MIQTKTKGNLDADEEKMLKDLLSSLQLNYVATAEAPGAKGEPQAPSDQPAPADAKAPPASPAPDAGTQKDPKFRKSYGA